MAGGGGGAAGASSALRRSTSARISLPALNFTTARSGMGMSMAGEFGFRPTRALRILTSKTPKLRNYTLFTEDNASEM